MADPRHKMIFDMSGIEAKKAMEAGNKSAAAFWIRMGLLAARKHQEAAHG